MRTTVIQSHMISTAKFSDDGLLRWSLERIWNPSRAQRICVFVLLNPSTATAVTNDPTVLRCIAFAKFWGYDGMRIINLVPFRATDPREMFTWFREQTLKQQLEFIAEASREVAENDVAKVVLGYGKLPEFMKQYTDYMRRNLHRIRNLYCIKLNKDGSPAHPLYLSGKLTPQFYLY